MPTVKQLQDAISEALSPTRHTLELMELLVQQYNRPLKQIVTELEMNSSLAISRQIIESQNHLLRSISAPGVAIESTASAIVGEALQMTRMANTIHDYASTFLPEGKIAKLWPGPTILDMIPDYSDMLVRLEAVRAQRSADGKGVLDSVGFSFVTRLIESQSYSYADYADLPKHTQHAAVTNTLLGFVKSEEFEDEIEQVFKGSMILKRRLIIVKEILQAIRERHYYLAIPPAFAQIEGIVVDLFVLKKFATVKGGKVFALDPHTKGLKLNKRDVPIELKGMGQLFDHCKFDEVDEAILSEISEFLTTSIVGPRNAILHGRDTTYGRAKLAATSLLLLFALCRGVP